MPAQIAIEPPATERWLPGTGCSRRGPRPSGAEREADEVDALTGARRRAPGLADVQHEIDRANRGDGRLIAAYIDVDGLKATNDANGHHAGDLMLKHIIAVMQTQIRSYEPIVRLGGDEFVCTISGTTIERVRERFARIAAQLRLTPEDGSITAGFAQLARGDSPMDLIDRADRQLITARDTRNQGQGAPRSTAPTVRTSRGTPTAMTIRRARPRSAR